MIGSFSRSELYYTTAKKQYLYFCKNLNRKKYYKNKHFIRSKYAYWILNYRIDIIDMLWFAQLLSMMSLGVVKKFLRFYFSRTHWHSWKPNILLVFLTFKIFEKLHNYKLQKHNVVYMFFLKRFLSFFFFFNCYIIFIVCFCNFKIPFVTRPKCIDEYVKEIFCTGKDHKCLFN